MPERQLFPVFDLPEIPDNPEYDERYKSSVFFDFEKASPVDALIIPMTQNMGYCISVMKTLREKGVKVQTYFEDKKLKKKMTYANRINAPYAVIIGDDEIAAGKVALKNLDTGEQTVCTAVEAAAIITE